MKTIGIITANEGAPWGGSEYLWFELAKFLRQNGYGVHVSVKDWKDRNPSELKTLKEYGIRIFLRRLKHPPFYKRVLNRLLPTKLKFPAIKSDHFYTHSELDLVIISQGHTFDGHPYMKECLSRGIDYVTISQSASDRLWPWNDILEDVQNGLKSSMMNYYVSHQNHDLAQWQTAQFIENHEIICNPVNINIDHAIPFPDASSNYQVAVVARFDLEAKAYDLLFKSLGIGKWGKRCVQFNCYGHDGPSRKLIEEMIKWRGLDFVTIKEFDSPHDIWTLNHLLILPSRFEGLPLALVESMLSGRPALVTDAGGNSEIVIDKVTGFISKSAGEVDSFSQKLEEAWSYREQWEKMGTQARLKALSYISKNPITYLHERLSEILG